MCTEIDPELGRGLDRVGMRVAAVVRVQSGRHDAALGATGSLEFPAQQVLEHRAAEDVAVTHDQDAGDPFRRDPTSCAESAEHPGNPPPAAPGTKRRRLVAVFLQAAEQRSGQQPTDQALHPALRDAGGHAGGLRQRRQRIRPGPQRIAGRRQQVTERAEPLAQS
ncbi:MAG: hypothetical protein U5K33_06650 [Halofilum sp. (in: g-proteobacteria)]|nr:hypothetical protein [Halofilum sp. (in: g-proteobacteria)]